MRASLFARRFAASRKSAQSGAVNAAEMGSRRRAGSAQLPLALAGFEAAMGLVDDIDPALAAHDAIVAVATPQGFQ
jgi:hypothetical protein